MIDVAYLKPGLLEVRTGMATGHDRVAGAPADQDLNGFCNNDPGMQSALPMVGDKLRASLPLRQRPGVLGLYAVPHRRSDDSRAEIGRRGRPRAAAAGRRAPEPMSRYRDAPVALRR